MSSSSDKIAVFHLVRKLNNIEMFEDFLNSYQCFEPGVQHDLVIIFKGFDNENEKTCYTSLLQGIDHLSFDVSDEGVDITAYIKATKAFAKEYHYLCFLNSHSMILSSYWLSKLYKNMKLKDVGLVGATGSWQSHRGSTSRPRLITTALVFSFLTIFSTKPIAVKREELSDVFEHLRFLLDIDCYPNIHIRTNGFMIPSSLMLENTLQNIISKYDAYRFESGRSGLSRYIKNKQLRLLLVGNDGASYDESEWRGCNVYMHNKQENLLISDNMTRKFSEGKEGTKNSLRRSSWEAKRILAYPQDWRAIVNRRKHAKKLLNQKAQLEKINKNSSSRIIVFGASILGMHFYSWLKDNTKNISFVAFVDNYLTTSPYKEALIQKPNYLIEHCDSFDYILISSNEYYDEILQQLIDLNIDESSII
ncbi:hypothetical protein [Paraglaciecola arctica]|uniref:hypothetical protein n=1 Tax=Paraglaciecola arctica TaxID=1128911 RepID=UPI001C064B76|nr:hypothetical protein [Paraglaciecola arctica]MBU3002084.1 hypothetical protein [Paraglaciecola arctica]